MQPTMLGCVGVSPKWRGADKVADPSKMRVGVPTQLVLAATAVTS